MIKLKKFAYAAMIHSHKNDAEMANKLSISFLFNEIETVFYRHKCDRVTFSL